MTKTDENKEVANVDQKENVEQEPKDTAAKEAPKEDKAPDPEMPEPKKQVTEEEKQKMIDDANQARKEAEIRKLAEEKKKYQATIERIHAGMLEENKVLEWIKRMGYQVLDTYKKSAVKDPFLKVTDEKEKEIIDYNEYLIIRKGAPLDREVLDIAQLHYLYKNFKEKKL